jgi:hypothetical protein
VRGNGGGLGGAGLGALGQVPGPPGGFALRASLLPGFLARSLRGGGLRLLGMPCGLHLALRGGLRLPVGLAQGVLGVAPGDVREQPLSPLLRTRSLCWGADFMTVGFWRARLVPHPAPT